MKALPPRVCIVQEHAGLGGVHSIVHDLQDVLRSQSWHVDNAYVPPSARPGWSLCRSAAQADVLVAAHNFRPAYAVWMLSLLLKKPWVVWVHGPVQEVLAEAQSHPAKRQWLRWLYQRVPHFVCISHHVRASLEHFLGYALPDTHVDINSNEVRHYPDSSGAR